MSLIKLLTCDKGGLLLASETPAIAQSVSDSMKWNTRSEVAIQILSQALQGFVIGINAVDDLGKGDSDLAVIPIAIIEYGVSDGLFSEKSAEFSLGMGGIFGGVSFIPGFPGGNDIKDPKDWGWTLLALGIEYGSNKIEEKLTKNNSVLTNKKDGKVLPKKDQDLEDGSMKNATINNTSSGKKILSTDY